MFDYNLYFNYRVSLKVKLSGHSNAVSTDNFKSENNGFYEKFRIEAEKEIQLVDKLGIKPVKTIDLFQSIEENRVSSRLPEFLHIYDPFNLISKIKPSQGLFLTSSRYKNANIYKLNDNVLIDLENYCRNFNFICSGTNSEAEIDFLKRYSGNALRLILPANSLASLDFINKFTNIIKFNFKKGLAISALDPFIKNTKYGFSLRNNLAFCLSKEAAVLYLSAKSSLSSVIKKFESAGKPVKIFECESEYVLNRLSYTHNIQGENNDKKITKKYNEHDYIQKFILNSLENENITIDNLLKLSNIKINAETKEIIKAISALEINSEIERCAGGILKKL